MRNTIAIIAILNIILACCNNPKIEDYTFKYSMEYVNSYKIECTIDSKTSSYTIIEYNYLFDNINKKREPILINGTISEKESKSIKSYIENAQLFKLEDYYGFKEPSEFICQSHIITPDKEKFITSSYVSEQLPKEYVSLISFMNKFISKYKKEI